MRAASAPDALKPPQQAPTPVPSSTQSGEQGAGSTSSSNKAAGCSSSGGRGGDQRSARRKVKASKREKRLGRHHARGPASPQCASAGGQSGQATPCGGDDADSAGSAQRFAPARTPSAFNLSWVPETYRGPAAVRLPLSGLKRELDDRSSAPAEAREGQARQRSMPPPPCRRPRLSDQSPSPTTSSSAHPHQQQQQQQADLTSPPRSTLDATTAITRMLPPGAGGLCMGSKETPPSACRPSSRPGGSTRSQLHAVRHLL
ncbi:MAG: hypothetical protein WDW38_006801 [Sanguina aurantia]